MTATDILLMIGKLNLAAAAAILLVLAIRPVIRRRLGASVAYSLWLAPLAAMAACLIPARRVLLPAPAAAPSAPEPAVINDGAFGQWSDIAVSGQAAIVIDPILILLALWLGGAVLAGALMVRLQRRFSMAARAGDIGPAVVGLIAPRIVTPNDFEDRFDAEERALVLAHEQTHIRRQDSRINGLVAALQCLFWFNPLIHLAIRPMRIDQELACDAAVVSRFPKARTAYARALVKTQLANRPLPLGCYWPSGTRHPLLERIKMLKTADTGGSRRLAGGIALATLCAASGFAAWAATPARTIYEAAAPVRALPPSPLLAAPAPAVSAPAPVRLAQNRVPAPQPPAAPVEPAAQAAPSGEICVTNACAKTATIARGAPGDRAYIGAEPMVAGQAFARYFNAENSISTQGRVKEVRLMDGMSAELVVVGDDGKTYRVMGGNPANLSPEMREAAANLEGRTIKVRGYLAFDQSCQGGGCVVNGRDVTFPDGTKVLTPATPSTPR